MVQFVFFAPLAISLCALQLKAFDRKGRKEISANFAKNNEHPETASLPLQVQ
jgi:hypothetical protein